MRKTNVLSFPEIRGEENFDVVMCNENGIILFKEVATGDIFEADDVREDLLSLPKGYTVGVLMPDGSVGKITPTKPLQQ